MGVDLGIRSMLPWAVAGWTWVSEARHPGQWQSLKGPLPMGSSGLSSEPETWSGVCHSPQDIWEPKNVHARPFPRDSDPMGQDPGFYSF